MNHLYACDKNIKNRITYKLTSVFIYGEVNDIRKPI